MIEEGEESVLKAMVGKCKKVKGSLKNISAWSIKVHGRNNCLLITNHTQK